MNLYWTILIIQVGFRKIVNKGYVCEWEGEKKRRSSILSVDFEKVIREKSLKETSSKDAGKSKVE